MPELPNASPEEQLPELMILNWRSVILVAMGEFDASHHVLADENPLQLRCSLRNTS
jgi:hypothetical protein